MAQAGFTPIQLYFSTTAAAVPTAGNLANGELAINITDGKLYYKNNSGVVTLLAGATAGPAGGSNTQVQYNNSGVLAGITGATTNGTTLTLVAPVLGTPASATLTNATGLPISTGVSGLGTGVGTALGVNVGSVGAFVVNGGALGTPSSGTVTNLTGTASININGTVGATTPATGAFTSVTENGYAVVSQADIGTAANEIPLNQYLGSMAYQDGTNYYNVGMTMGFRNRFINGAMTFDQRYAGAAVAIGGGGIIIVDRWVSQTNGALSTAAGQSMQQTTVAPSGFVNSLYTYTTTGSTASSTQTASFSQFIEGTNIQDLGFGTSSAKTVTLSFWVRSSLVGNYGARLSNSAVDRSYVAMYLITAANTWEYKTITMPGDASGTWLTTNGVGIRATFDLGSGTNRQTTAGSWQAGDLTTTSAQANWIGTASATFYITGVQLEVGTQATPFDWRPYGTELLLCQRYFEKSYAQGTAVGTATNTNTIWGSGQVSSGTTAEIGQGLFFKVVKRASATITFYDDLGASGKGNRILLGVGNTAGQTLNANYTGDASAFINSSGVSANIQSFHYTASAEL